MDKRVIFAVAGSGKTTHLIDELDLERRVLLITYTENNFAHLRFRVLQKFGYLPPNIVVCTYFKFLHNFCYRPLLQMRLGSRGMNFHLPPAQTARFALTQDARYLDGRRRLYHNRLAKLLEVKGCLPAILARMERYFDRVFVDEVQDFGGHDFNLLAALCRANTDVLFVGDFFQHTFDTSRDGSVNRTLHDDFGAYAQRFAAQGITVDRQSLRASRRCSTTVCDFIREHLQIDMHAHEARNSDLSVVEQAPLAKELYRDPVIVKLFYSSHTGMAVSPTTGGPAREWTTFVTSVSCLGLTPGRACSPVTCSAWRRRPATSCTLRAHGRAKTSTSSVSTIYGNSGTDICPCRGRALLN